MHISQVGHSYVDPSASTILRTSVRIPSTKCTLYIELGCDKDENKPKRGRDLLLF